MIRFLIFIVGFLSFINGSIIPIDADCKIGSNDICLINHSHDNCNITAAYPHTCAKRNHLDNCDLIFNWEITKNIINFSLIKYNYRLNEWIGIIFSKESIKSDIVIGVVPTNTEKSKIINGVIEGYDVILDEDAQTSNYIFNKRVHFSDKSVEFTFSRNLTNNNLNENGIDFSGCLTDKQGIGMFLLNGSLSQTEQVLFNGSSVPRSIGPFCFNSCVSKSDDNTFTLDVEFNTNEGRNFAIDSETSTDSSGTTESNFRDTTLLMISKPQNFTDTSTVMTSSFTSDDPMTTSIQIQESLEPITARSNQEFTSAESTTEELVTTNKEDQQTTDQLTSNSETTSIQTTVVSTEESIEITTDEPTTIEATTSAETTMTTTYETTTVKRTNPITTKPLECPSQSFFNNPLINQINNAYQFKMDQFYDKATDTVNYTIVILNPENSSRFSVHSTENNNEAFVIYGDFDPAQNQLETFTNLTNSFNSNSFQFALPRTFEFSNGLILSDCVKFKIYYSKANSFSQNISIRSDNFLIDISENKFDGASTTNQVCLNTCCTAPKSPIEVYLQMNIINRNWTDDYNNLSLSTSQELSNQIRTMIDNKISSGNNCLTIESFELISIRKKSNSIRRKRIVASDSILVTAKSKFLSSTSDALTRQIFQQNLDLLASNQAQSIIFNSPIVSAKPPETTTAQASSIMSSTATPQTTVILSTPSSALSNTTALSPQIDDNYSAKLAIALSLSLIATLIIMGGALFGFLYWRKAKLNQSGSSSQNHSILRSLGNRFSGSGYKQPNVVKIDGIPPNNYTNDDFELQNYDNETFEQNEGYHQFTDFSGSREVGIDVGPFGDDVNYTNPVNDNVDNSNPLVFKKMVPNEQPIQEEPAKVSHLLGIAGEAINANNRFQEESTIKQSSSQKPEDIIFTEKTSDPFYNYEADNNDIEIDTNLDQKEMSREEFDDLFNKRFSEILGDKSFEKLLDKKSDDIDKTIEENEVEISKEPQSDGNMFNNIEQNFPELFGETSKENQNKNSFNAQAVDQNKTPEYTVPNDIPAPKGFKSATSLNRAEDRSDISSIEMELTEDENAEDADADSLQDNLKKEAMFEDGISLSLKSDDDYNDDFKAIEVNAIKSLKINNEDNSFVMTNQATTFKQLIMANRDQQSSADEEQHDSLSDSLEGDSQNLELKDDKRRNIEFDDTADEDDEKEKTFVNNLMPENDFTNDGFPNPRRCRISVANLESGLGIHLCGTKNHMIKNIESDSPAEEGGLKPGDKILVINKENVEEADYTTVVDRLKESLANNQDIDLLVMNIIEYNLFKQQNPILQNLNKSIEVLESETGIKIKKETTNKIFTSESEIPNNEQNDEEDEDTKSSNSSDFNMKKTDDIENFVNTEFNPFHDVPNEMFSPFLHYSSIPPPENFQAEGSEKFFTLDQDPFSDQFESSHKTEQLNPNPANNIFDDTNSDIMSENSTNSSNNLKNDPKLNDFFPSATISEMNLISNDASNFDEQFLKNYPSKPAKNLSELIMTKSTDNGKLIQSQEFNSSNKIGDVTLEYSENSNDKVQTGTPNLRDRF